MAKAIRTEGPRAPLFFSALLILILGSLASAQSVDLSDLEICTGLESAELKLACFEAIIATGRRVSEPVPEPMPAVVEEAVGSGPATIVEPKPKPVPEMTTAEPALGPASSESDQFGNEHLQKAVEPPPDKLVATVIEVTQRRNRTLSFHLSNGQIWRQIEPRHFPYPKNEEFDVTISTGMMGEYRLQIGENGRKVRIRRVQ